MCNESRWGFVENDCELPSSVVGKANPKAIKAVHPGNGTHCYEKYKKQFCVKGKNSGYNYWYVFRYEPLEEAWLNPDMCILFQTWFSPRNRYQYFPLHFADTVPVNTGMQVDTQASQRMFSQLNRLLHYAHYWVQSK